MANADGKRSDQTFSFEAKADGTYKLAVYKPGGYVITIKTIEVATAPVVENVELWLLGDVLADGKIDAKDVLKLRRHVFDPVTYPLTEQEQACANLYASDDKIDAKDVLKLRRYVFDPVTYPL